MKINTKSKYHLNCIERIWKELIQSKESHRQNLFENESENESEVERVCVENQMLYDIMDHLTLFKNEINKINNN